MVKLVKNQAVRHISWMELDEMVDGIASAIGSMYPPGVNIYYNDIDAVIPTYMLCYALKRNMAPGGVVFGLNDVGKNVDICFYNIEFPSEHFNFKPKYSLETLYSDEEGHFERVTFPWQK
ncbi:MAG: hypothetical protein N0C84_00450 [Candidatus Thiodiazotropha taylori]|uniref:Uncharacterized protein n=1 Tax=Candidatus Thiodiazotropha taylori TaxID=2792791 RepID=A0A9E4K9W1_9GAMM|nr:hypothetical protein [Candidatus Thiodiazotropha taylori]MCW4254914.1 hypothetical protein [Candidatus Thiodiazotropha taylori]